MKAIVENMGSIGIKHICASHAPENPASGRVMEKIGMTFWQDGTYTCLDGKVFEAKYYMLDID